MGFQLVVTIIGSEQSMKDTILNFCQTDIVCYIKVYKGTNIFLKKLNIEKLA